jgi:hypothetical protein
MFSKLKSKFSQPVAPPVPSVQSTPSNLRTVCTVTEANAAATRFEIAANKIDQAAIRIDGASEKIKDIVDKFGHYTLPSVPEDVYPSLTSDNLNKIQNRKDRQVPPRRISRTASNTSIPSSQVSEEYLKLPSSSKTSSISTEENIPITTTAFEQNIPATTIEQNIPATTIEQNIPAATIEQNIPATTIEQNIPATTFEENIPATTIEENIPATIEQNIPATTIEQNIPATTIEENIPAATIEENIPAATIEENIPAATIEENIPATFEQNMPATFEQNMPTTAFEENIPATFEQNMPTTAFEENIPATAIPEQNMSLQSTDMIEPVSQEDAKNEYTINNPPLIKAPMPPPGVLPYSEQNPSSLMPPMPPSQQNVEVDSTTTPLDINEITPQISENPLTSVSSGEQQAQQESQQQQAQQQAQQEAQQQQAQQEAQQQAQQRAQQEAQKKVTMWAQNNFTYDMLKSTDKNSIDNKNNEIKKIMNYYTTKEKLPFSFFLTNPVSIYNYIDVVNPGTDNYFLFISKTTEPSFYVVGKNMEYFVPNELLGGEYSSKPYKNAIKFISMFGNVEYASISSLQENFYFLFPVITPTKQSEDEINFSRSLAYVLENYYNLYNTLQASYENADYMEYFHDFILNFMSMSKAYISNVFAGFNISGTPIFYPRDEYINKMKEVTMMMSRRNPYDIISKKDIIDRVTVSKSVLKKITEKVQAALRKGSTLNEIYDKLNAFKTQGSTKGGRRATTREKARATTREKARATTRTKATPRTRAKTSTKRNIKRRKTTRRVPRRVPKRTKRNIEHNKRVTKGTKRNIENNKRVPKRTKRNIENNKKVPKRTKRNIKNNKRVPKRGTRRNN